MARRLLLLFAALLATLALAPGHSAADAQNRVGAFLSVAPTFTGPTGSESSCTRPGSAAPKPRIAAGCCVAKKRGDGPKLGNLKRVGDAELKRAVGDPHAFKAEVLGTGKNLGAWDVHHSGDRYYLVNRRTGAVVPAD